MRPRDPRGGLMSVWALQSLPWCGRALTPVELWSRWRLDPGLLVALACLLWIGVRWARRPRAFVAGWVFGALTLVSPLCPLSVALFTGRALQHVVLTLVAAPLMAWGLGLSRRRSRALPAAAVFAVTLWAWHTPGLYDLTFHNDLVYWGMHASLAGAALWLWSELLAADQGHGLGGLLAVLLTCLQEGLLGALLTLAPRPLYGAHALTTAAWGLTALQDQALGGALMWVPGGAVFLAVALLQFARLLHAPEPPSMRLA